MRLRYGRQLAGCTDGDMERRNYNSGMQWVPETPNKDNQIVVQTWVWGNYTARTSRYQLKIASLVFGYLDYLQLLCRLSREH